MTSPMVEMSRAIRHTLEDHAPTLRELPADVLDEFVEIVGAFYFDLKDEQERRRSTGYNIREGSAMLAERIAEAQE